MAKSKAAPTDFSGLIKDEASLKRANDLHAQKIPLLEKAANIREKIAEIEEKGAKATKDEKAQRVQYNAELRKTEAQTKKIGTEQQKLVAGAKELSALSEEINDSAEHSVDAWSSLSNIYSGQKKKLQELALETTKLNGLGVSISRNTKMDDATRTATIAKVKKIADINSSISSTAYELSQLTSDDEEKKILLETKLDRQLSKLQDIRKELAANKNLSKEDLAIADSQIDAKKAEIALAKEMSGQSRLQKEINEELRENLESIHKSMTKAWSAIKMLFSGWQGATSLLLFGAGEIAEKFGEMGKELGVGLFEMKGLKSEALLLGAILGDTAKEAVIELGKELGDNRHVTFGMAQDAALLAANYHLSGEQAAFMTTAFGELSGKSEETGNNTREYVKQLALANGVAPAQAMGDIAKNSEFFALYSKDGGKNIGDAAVAAAKLGVGLDVAAKVADHLLDYQSSVQDEMEASVLLGRDMNLSKARELAYNGDIAGAMKEGLEAAGGIAAYNEMDPYQRAATAKAIGVSNAEMQKMISHQESLNGMNGVGEQIYSRTAEYLQNMGNTITGKVLKGMGGLILGAGKYSEALKNVKEGPLGGVIKKTYEWIKATKLGQMLSATSSAIGSKIGGVASKIGSMIGLSKAPGVEAATSIAGPLTKAGLPDKRFKANKIAESTESIAGKAKDDIKDKASDAIKDKINPESVTSPADSASKGDDGSAFKTKAQNIAAGLKEFANGKVILGALALIPVGIGLLGLLPGLPTLYLMGKMSFGSILLGFENLSLGLMAMGTGTTLAGAGVLALTSIALIMMLPGLVTLGLMGVMAPLITLGFGALVGGLSALGAAAPLAGIGVAILMGLGLAFAFFGAGVMMVGMGIKLAMDGISSMVTVLPQLAANLGPLISMILPIFGLAAAIMALSLSLMMLGTMGMIALPVLLALGALGAVAGGLMGGGEGGGSNDEMIAILKSIDSKVGGAPAINMDSKKVTAASNDGAARRGDSGGTKY
jgi:hypothetical protein